MQMREAHEVRVPLRADLAGDIMVAEIDGIAGLVRRRRKRIAPAALCEHY